MATGKSGYVDFTSTNTVEGTRVLRIYWKETYTGNVSTVSIEKVQFSTSAEAGVQYQADFIIQINGVTVKTLSDPSWTVYPSGFNTFYDIKRGDEQVTGSGNITHDAQGKATATFSIIANNWDYAGLVTRYYQHPAKFSGSQSVTLTTLPVGTLSMSAGAGSSIGVTRNGAALSAGAALYYGDSLKITFGANTGYNLGTHTVNGTTFTSGGTHSVAGNVAVVSTATKKTYTLTSPSGHYTLTVYRSSSPIGGQSAGNLSNGATLYYNDVLKITATAETGYRITALTVNGTAFTSGGNHTVQGAVTVAVTTEAYGASTFTTSGSTMGSPVSFSITKANSSFTSTLKYRYSGDADTAANWTQIGSAKFSGTTASWTPNANTLGAKIPTALSGTWVLKLETYSGDTLIGSTTKNLTLSLPADAAPTVAAGWAGFSYSNAGTAASGIAAPVKGYSILRWVLDVSKITLKYGATLASVKAVCGGTTQTKTASGTYSMGVAAVNNSLTVTVTDSRGKTYTNVNPLTLTANDYAKPSLSGVSVFRCNSGGAAAEDGAYISAKATAVFSSIDGKNSATLTARVKPVGGSYGTAVSLTSGTAQVLGGSYSDTVSYVVQITVTDALGNSATVERTVPSAKVTLNLKDGGEGAAFGGYAADNNLLDVFWNQRVRGALRVGVNDKLSLFEDSEGGNVRIYPADAAQTAFTYWEIDANGGLPRLVGARAGGGYLIPLTLTSIGALQNLGISIGQAVRDFSDYGATYSGSTVTFYADAIYTYLGANRFRLQLSGKCVPTSSASVYAMIPKSKIVSVINSLFSKSYTAISTFYGQWRSDPALSLGNQGYGRTIVSAGDGTYFGLARRYNTSGSEGAWGHSSFYNSGNGSMVDIDLYLYLE